jgi:hypothetical protein
VKYEYKTTIQKLFTLHDAQGERKYIPLPLSPPEGEGPWKILHVHTMDGFYESLRATIIWERAFEETQPPRHDLDPL